MSENKNDEFEQNQDFIEGNDDLAESIDMNFADTTMDDIPEEDIIEMDSKADDVEFDSVDQDDFGDEWAEDFGNDDYEMGQDDLTNDDFNPGQMVHDKPQKNWFNIAIFAFMGLAICFVIYAYIVPIIFGNSNTVEVAQMPATDNTQIASVDTDQNNEILAQQAVAPQLVEIEEAGGLLANPELLDDGVESIQRPASDAVDVFETLGEIPQVVDNEVDDIFAAIEDLRAPDSTDDGAETTSSTTTPQNLPAPADEMPVVETPEIVFENLVDNGENAPRMPSDETDTVIVDTGVQSLNQMTTDTNEQPATPVIDDTQIMAMNDRMDAIMNRLDDLAKQIETVSNEKNNVTQSSGPSPDVAGLEQTIAKLEKRVSDLSKQKASAPAKTPTRAISPAPTYRAPVVQAAPKWELRGASPNEAYVAEIGTQNLRTIAVGDTLSGIGRIQSIGQENGRWVVRGTSGRINQ